MEKKFYQITKIGDGETQTKWICELKKKSM